MTGFVSAVERSSHPAAKLTTPLLLYALNLLIVWRLLSVEYTEHFYSIEPLFYALAAHIKDHWWHVGWWREWNCGMPFRYTYQPLLHYAVAGVSALSGLTIARSFHVTFALLYAAGPVTLYFLARRLSGSLRTALAAALLYSLWSPSLWLVREHAVDAGGAFHAALRFGRRLPFGVLFTMNWGGLLHARRLQTAVMYGDGPNVAGLTLIPLALLLIDRLVEKRTAGRVIAAALGAIAVVLTNIPAGIGLSMALLAYVIAAESGRRAFAVASSLVLGYLLTAPLMPVSGLMLTAHNTQWMDRGGQMNGPKLAGIVAGVLVLGMISYGLSRLGAGPFLRFALLFSAISGTVVLGKAWGGFSVLAHSLRFHLVMEMAIVMSVAAALQLVVVRKRWIKIAVGTGAVLAVCWQLTEYRAYAREIIRREDPESHSEVKIARWMEKHAAGNRVWVPGSVSFWMNAFTTTPQLIGCCDQNYLSQSQRIAAYQMGSDDGAGADAARISIIWLKAMGVKYAAMCGARSTEVYRSLRHPKKFEGVLKEVWRDGDDAIFEVSEGAGTLAHWVAPLEAVRAMPINGLDVVPLEPYVAAIGDANRRPASLVWDGTEAATIHGFTRPGDVLSVQIPFHAGWHADGPGGKRLATGQDALGFLLISPNCEGECTVRLRFDGGEEARVLALVCGLTWSVALVALARGAITSYRLKPRALAL